MARPKGLPKTGGRNKGSRNLKTLVLRESLDRVSFDVIKELCELYMYLDPDVKAKLLMAFLPYLFPKPSSVPVGDLRTYEMMLKADGDAFGHLDGKPEEEK